MVWYINRLNQINRSIKYSSISICKLYDIINNINMIYFIDVILKFKC